MECWEGAHFLRKVYGVKDYPDITEATPKVLTEEELVAWKAEGGARRVVRAHGRPWLKTLPGFYEGVHYLARFRAEEARRPVRGAWGFRVALVEEDADEATATWPMCMLLDLQDYERSQLRRSVREDLRKCRSHTRLVWLTDAELLREQGYDVYLSAAMRVGKKGVRSREDYLAHIEGLAGDDRRLVEGALVDGRLVGYCDSFAVDGTAYGWNISVHTDHLRTCATNGLQYETFQAYRRTGKVFQVVNGLHTPEQPGLMKFKERMGFQVVQVPVRLEMPTVLRYGMRKASPWGYYRMTGHLCSAPGPAGAN
jgi:hypothetical protein